MKVKIKILFFFSFVSMTTYGGFTWVQIVNLPMNRGAGSGFAIGNKGYITSGVNGTANPSYQDLWEYDPFLNTWTQKANCPGPARYSCVAFVLGNLGYLTTGWTWPGTVQLKDMWAYDPLSNSWTPKSSFPGAARYTTTSFVINGFGYVGLGYAPYHNDFYKYDPVLDLWTAIANLPSTARQSAGGFSLNNKGYVIGGDDGVILKEVWEYNPVLNSWLQKNKFPVTTVAGKGFAICGKGYFGTGVSSGSYLNTIYEYDPIADSWNQIPSLPSTPRASVFNFVIGDTAYIIAGLIGNGFLATNTCWKLVHLPPAISTMSQLCNKNIQFNTDSADFYHWVFGDGDSSLSQNPLHFFPDTGTYNVSLISTQNCFTDTVHQQVIIISDSASSAFTYAIDTCQKTVSFANQSSGATTYSWKFGDGDSSSSASPVHTYSSPGNYTISLLASSLCDSAFIQQIIDVPNIVDPTSSFSYTIDSCINNVVFTNQSTDASSYSWNFGDNDTSNLLGPSHIYANPGNYTVTLITHGTCIDSSKQTIINLSPTNAVMPAFTFNYDTCTGIITLNNNSQNAYSYFWFFGDGDSSSLPNPTHQYQSYNSFNIKLFSTGFCGTDSVQHPVNIVAPNITDAAYTYIIDTCNILVQFNNQSVFFQNINWDFGDGDSSNQISPTHTFNNSGNYNVTLNATGLCNTDSFQQQIYIPAPISPIPSFTFSIDTCSADISFHNTSSSAYSYLWNFGDGNTSGFINPIHNYQISGNYNVILTANGECSSLDSSQSVTAPVALNVSSVFDYLIDPCSASVQFHSITLNATQINWDFGDNSYSTIPNPNHTYNTAGNYSVTLIASGSCNTDTSKLIVNSPDSLNRDSKFTYTIDTCSGDIQFINLSGNVTNVQWYFGDGSFSSQTNPSHSYLNAGSYSVYYIVNANLTCADSSSQLIIFPNAPELTLFIPNAFTPNNDNKNDFFSISGTNPCFPLTIIIFNRWGQKVFETDDFSSTWDGTCHSAKVPEGTYFYLIKGKKGYINIGTISVLR